MSLDKIIYVTRLVFKSYTEWELLCFDEVCTHLLWPFAEQWNQLLLPVFGNASSLNAFFNWQNKHQIVKVFWPVFAVFKSPNAVPCRVTLLKLYFCRSDMHGVSVQTLCMSLGTLWGCLRNRPSGLLVGWGGGYCWVSGSCDPPGWFFLVYPKTMWRWADAHTHQGDRRTGASLSTSHIVNSTHWLSSLNGQGGRLIHCACRLDKRGSCWERLAQLHVRWHSTMDGLAENAGYMLLSNRRAWNLPSFHWNKVTLRFSSVLFH